MWLGVSEGIETALAAALIFEVPTVAAIRAGGLEGFTPPEGVQSLIVFADNDASGTGGAAALRLAGRVAATGITTRISMPERTGTDWADVWFETNGAVV